MSVKLRSLNLVLFVVSCIILTACSTAPTTNDNQRNRNANTAQANSSPANSSPANSSQAKSSQTNSSKPSQPDQSTTGSIEVTSTPPGARVLLISMEGGAGEPQSKGASPTTITGLQPGKYTVDLEKPGYKFFQKEVDVKPGKTMKVNASLKKQ